MNPETIEALIAKGRDTYESRLAAGQARRAAGDLERAIEHLTVATKHQPDRTIAWQELGRCLNDRHDREGARAAWERARSAARTNGDKQAEKVIGVWLRRLDRDASSD